MKKIYLDNGASTPVDIEVAKEIEKYLTNIYGNASSNHDFGEEACEVLERSRITIANALNASPDEIVFTSGGTESNNFALKGIAFANKEKGNHIITTKIDHGCVLNSCRWLEKQGFEVTYLDVDENGFISLEDLKNKIKDETILVSVIHGNNEIGVIQNIEEIGKICNERNIYFHTDACQSFTKVPIDTKKINIDLITINAHKIHGPKGVGALYIKKGTTIEAWQHGGGHEKNRRSGTENIPSIVGFAKSVELALKTDIKKIEKLRDKLINGLLKIEGTRLNGHRGHRLPNNVNISFRGVDGEILLEKLNENGIAASTGSACSAKKAEPSHVLKAIGLDFNEYPGTIRLTLSKFTTEEEIDYALSTFNKLISQLRGQKQDEGC